MAALQRRTSALVLLAALGALFGATSFVQPLGRCPGSAAVRTASSAWQAEERGLGQTGAAGAGLCQGAAVFCFTAAGLLMSRRAAKRSSAARRAEDAAYGASHTSFYTDAVAKDKYDTIDEVMGKKMKDPKLQAMVKELLDACVKITEALRVNLVTVNDASNAFGAQDSTRKGLGRCLAMEWHAQTPAAISRGAALGPLLVRPAARVEVRRSPPASLRSLCPPHPAQSSRSSNPGKLLGLGAQLGVGWALVRRARLWRAALRPGAGVRAVSTLEAPVKTQEFQYKIDLEGLVSLCKRRGFVFQSGEVYGGYQGFFDYGPLGVELKNNLKKMWWRRLVHGRDDIVGLDSSIISNPSVHQASGHVDNFSDPMVDCTDSKKRFRADQLMWAKVVLEDGTDMGCVSAIESGDTEKVLMKAAKKKVKQAGAEGNIQPLDIKDMTQASEDEVPLVPSPATGKPGTLTGARSFNLMFETKVGPYSDAASVSYLRPETAQGIFVNFKNVATVSRLKIPFGIAQVGKAFRNEITPRQFLFRSREFEQLEIEYFIDPEADFQTEQEAWIVEMWNFLKAIGLDERLMDREVHEGDGLAHYARACTDIIFRYPFGQQELLGVAARGEYDLQQHSKASGTLMEYQVPGQKRRFVPHVIEPSLGVDRLFLALLCSAYDEDEVGGEKRSLLRFEPCVAPITCAIFPLLKNKPELVAKAKDLARTLRMRGFNVLYDEAGSIGKRYRRMDEVGTPFCCTIDFETLDDDTVTVRSRDDPLTVVRKRRDEVAPLLDEACTLRM